VKPVTKPFSALFFWHWQPGAAAPGAPPPSR